MKIIWQIITILVRTVSNALTAAVWYAIFSAIVGLFSGNFVSGLTGGWEKGWAWSINGAGVFVAFLFAALGLVHGVRLAQAESYFDVGGVFAFLWDHLWSLPNTIIGSIWCLITFGKDIDTTNSRGTGRLVLTSGMFFDIEADQAWLAITGQALLAKHLTMFEIPVRA